MPVIKVENLSKKYIISHQRQSYLTLREEITNWFKFLPKKIVNHFTNRHTSQENEEFWALNDVSFEVEQRERLGIIGRNGAGKSTLLKILSRITEPTQGKVQIKNRVASLLEVGTGFHPELTGRENIYLNGAILGMSKREIKKKFDEIVAFSEIEKFLDTPVKRYSSGMYVRLAFAVAAHLEPEILLIDEVLAVGDIQFQKKCLGKMEDVSQKEGRTVIFVSHNMAMINSLCNKAILLNKGEIETIGNTTEVIETYYSQINRINGESGSDNTKQKTGDDVAHLISAKMTNTKGEVITNTTIDQDVIIEMEYEVTQNNAYLIPSFDIYTSNGICAFVTSDCVIDPEAKAKNIEGRYIARCIIPGNILNSGTYYIGIVLSSISPAHIIHFKKRDLFQLTITDPIEGTITRGGYCGVMPGVVRPVLKWECERIK